MPKHQEKIGSSFLLDEHTGRMNCYGKCNFRLADICQIASYIWECTNQEARARISQQSDKYRRKSLHQLAKEKKKKSLFTSGPTRNWRINLKPFPKERIESLARQRGIPTLGIERAIEMGLLWYLPERFWDNGGGGNPHGAIVSVKRKKIPESWVLTDRRRGQAISRRRMDGLPWYGGAKSKNLPGCSGKTEIGLTEALECRGEEIRSKINDGMVMALCFCVRGGQANGQCQRVFDLPKHWPQIQIFFTDLWHN